MASTDRNEWKARIDRALSELKSSDGAATRGECGRDEKRAAHESSSESATH